MLLGFQNPNPQMGFFILFYFSKPITRISQFRILFPLIHTKLHKISVRTHVRKVKSFLFFEHSPSQGSYLSNNLKSSKLNRNFSAKLLNQPCGFFHNQSKIKLDFTQIFTLFNLGKKGNSNWLGFNSQFNISDCCFGF